MKHYTVELLNKSHDRGGFTCDEESLDNYLGKQASQDMKRSLAAVYILTEPGQDTVLGFYTLSASAISLMDMPEEVSRKLPRYPSVPVVLLGRLAIGKAHQRQGLGDFLLLDALKRSYFLSKEIGSMAVVVDALNEKAMEFYLKFGFNKFSNSNKLFLAMETIKRLDL